MTSAQIIDISLSEPAVDITKVHDTLSENYLGLYIYKLINSFFCILLLINKIEIPK
jgi:hypothetical protein